MDQTIKCNGNQKCKKTSMLKITNSNHSLCTQSTGRVFSVGRSCEKVSFELGVIERELRMVRAVNRRMTTIF